MKKTILTGLLCLQLVLGGGADEKLRLSQEDAKQLHAYLLTGELLDFGQRADSASAYLMAVELMLEYPTGTTQKMRALEFCARARQLAGNDNFILMWADRLESRAGKVVRGSELAFRSKEGVLRPGASLYLPGRYQLAWVKGENLQLETLDSVGQVVKTGTEIEVSGDWRLTNVGDRISRYRLLLKKR